jgi:N-acetyl-gamma-glutamyl-phosphate reductase
MCAIDNLVKGAAGGAIQWMNRLWSLPETSGLLTPSPAWT